MSADPVTLARLATVCSGRVLGDPATRIRDVTHDSRWAGPHDLFVAMRGARFDGHDFVATTEAGAACVEQPVGASIPQLIVADTRAAISALAAEVHGHPSRDIPVVGITGTNGKTTVAHMLASIVEADGGVPGVAGTVGARIGSRHLQQVRTSPEASDFQRLLREMVEAGVTLAAVEVSSHALAYGRTAATQFAVVAFTNLSQDHLDLHGDMDSYFAAKASLFEDHSVPAVINVGDPWGRRLAASRPGKVVRVGPEQDFSTTTIASAVTSSTFELATPAGSRTVRLPLGGAFNVENAVIAAACAMTLDIGLDSVAEGLTQVAPIPGRMEPVTAGQAAAILVDYAHTPDGIDQVIASVRPVVGGRIIAVVGAGGDRDQEKRPAMGRAVSRADLAIITSDNPRSEDPSAIIEAVVSGADGPARLVIEPDRRRAIAAAVGEAAPGDVVLILGKGHESGQEIGGELLPFDDRAVAREAVLAQ
jgi:UDP-N-acetylmuramoyl-L-alanyl-D-glutamate--2,6-diaminopimelate ligase